MLLIIANYAHGRAEKNGEVEMKTEGGKTE